VEQKIEGEMLDFKVWSSLMFDGLQSCLFWHSFVIILEVGSFNLLNAFNKGVGFKNIETLGD
jgi:hypothetical protein